VVVDIVAEGWGQGHARASALGSAGMMAMLAAAANGQTQVRKPHLVEAVRGAGRADASTLRWSLADAEPNRIAHEAAEVIISGLSFSHRAGTARLACEQVFDARTCSQMDWIAGKTGTPTFPNDDRSLDDLARLCAPPANRPRRDRDACGPLRPYKWYVAAYRTNPSDPRWNKVIGVLTERNWLADSGRVHGAGDHGPNPAAEIAMQIAGRHAGVLAQDSVLAQGPR
jgi:cell division protein FtsI/penicillin-binding protein 2